MKKNIYKIGVLSFLGLGVYSQAQTTGLNTTDPKATLDVRAANANGTTNEGIIAPILTKTRVASIATPVEGTLVYVNNTTYTAGSNATINNRVANITDKGYYFYNGTVWVRAEGVAGKTMLNGTTAPTTTIGTVGDFYIDTTTSMIYGPKTASGWGTGKSLVGPQGAQGVAGSIGQQGPIGPTGVVAATNGITYDANTKTVSLPAGTSGQVLKWNATTNTWAPAADANTTYANSASNTISGNQIQRAALTGDVTAAANSNATTISPNAVTSAKIADGTITAADLADGAVTAAKLNAMGATTVGQVLKWNGTAWAPASDSGLTSEVDGIVGNEVLNATANSGLVRSGSGTAASPYTLGLTNGTAAGQVMKWNGTAWAPAADTDTNTTYTGSTSVTLNGTSFQRAALTGDVTAAANSNTVTINNGAITNAKVADGAITANKLAAGVLTNIYNADGTLTGNRIVTTGNNTLTVKGTSVTPFIVEGNNWTPLRVITTNASGGGIVLQPGTDGWENRVEMKATVTGDMHLYTNGAGNAIAIRKTGNVGIGTESPTAKLDVAGNMRVQVAGGNWITGKTGTQGITSATKLTDSYHPFLRQETKSGHFVNIGGIQDRFGIFGYLATREATANSYDHSFIMDLNTGNIGINTNPDTTNKLYVNGSTRIQSLSGTGDRVVLADATGVLKAGTLPTTSISGAGNLTGTGITVGNGTGAVLKNVTLAIADNAITSAKIQDGQVATADLANGAVTAAKLNAMGATNGQVLKWNGTAWAPAADANTADTSIYTVDGTLTSNRKVTTAGNALTIEGTAYHPLQINANNGTGNGGLVIRPMGDANKRVEMNTTPDGHLRLWAGRDVFYADRTTGNVGIGTNSPADKLSVQGGIRSTGSTNIGGYLDLENTLKTGDAEGARWRIYNMTNKVTTGGAYTPGLHFWNYSTAATGSNLGSKMVLTDDGNLGIGVGSSVAPTAKLDVNGDARVRALSGTGDRVVLADATGILKAGTLPTTSISGAGNLTGTGITVGNGTGAVLKNVTLAIADNAITSAKIQDGQVATADLANGAVTAAKLNAMGATTAGQVLKWNGTAWAPAADTDTNTTYTAGNGIAISGTAISLSTPVRNVTAAYTLVAADFNGYVYVNSATPVTVTVPNTLPAGFSCVIVQQGVGQVTIAGSSVTLQTARGTKTRTQYSAVGVIKRTTAEATITGDAIK